LKTRVFYDGINYRLRNSRRILKLIEKVIGEHRKPYGNLSFIFMDNEGLISINKEFLQHNYFTDVIAFNYSENEILNGEIYLSIEKIKENAINYKVSLNDEVLRVMIHGTLHLCGYNDKTNRERNVIKRLEDYWLEMARKI
jgi:probable rRNA maturation factor